MDRTFLKRGQVEEFFDAGFILIRGAFSSTETAEMCAAFERLRRTAEGLGTTCMHRGSQFVLDQTEARQVRIQRIVWCGGAEPVLSRYGADRRLLRMAALLLGSSQMNQLINQAHFKLPGDGVEFPWHQDSTHRRYGNDEWRDVNGRGSYVQTVLALDETSEASGPLQLIPGSGRAGHLNLPKDGPIPTGLFDESRAVTATMNPGDVLLFGPYTLHRSLPNRSTQPRRVFINGFAYPGANTRVYPGEGAGRLLQL